MLKFLFKPDPGKIRLKLALRALLSSAIATAIVFKTGKLTLITAILSAMFTQTAIYGNNRREKCAQGLLITLCFLLAYTLGILTKNIPWLTHILMVGGAFFAFYVKRFGPRFAFFPLFTWVMYFLATIFVVPKPLDWLSIPGVITGSIVAILVALYIFPEQKERLLAQRIQQQLALSTLMLTWLKQNLSKKMSRKRFNQHFFVHHHLTLELLADNLCFAGDLTNHQNSYAKQVEKLLLHLGALVQANGMLGDATRSLLTNKAAAPEPRLRDHITKILTQLLMMIRQIKLDKKQLKIHFPKNIPALEKSLAAFQAELCQYQSETEVELIYFFNCHTSLLYYWQNLYALRNFDANFH